MSLTVYMRIAAYTCTRIQRMKTDVFCVSACVRFGEGEGGSWRHTWASNDPNLHAMCATWLLRPDKLSVDVSEYGVGEDDNRNEASVGGVATDVGEQSEAENDDEDDVDEEDKNDDDEKENEKAGKEEDEEDEDDEDVNGCARVELMEKMEDDDEEADNGRTDCAAAAAAAAAASGLGVIV